MVELDEEVAAVWQSVVNGDAKWLADQILKFNLTKEAVIAGISKEPEDFKHRAFQAILKNRTFHGGILAEGATFLKYGENGKKEISPSRPWGSSFSFSSTILIRTPGIGFPTLPRFLPWKVLAQATGLVSVSP